MEDDQVGEHTVERTSERRGAGRRRVARDPALEERARDTVSHLHAGDAGADLDDLSGGVRAGKQRKLYSAWRDAVLDHRDVAIVERDSAYLDAYVAVPERRVRPLLELESVDPERVGEPPGSHCAAVGEVAMRGDGGGGAVACGRDRLTRGVRSDVADGEETGQLGAHPDVGGHAPVLVERQNSVEHRRVR